MTKVQHLKKAGCICEQPQCSPFDLQMGTSIGIKQLLKKKWHLEKDLLAPTKNTGAKFLFFITPMLTYADFNEDGRNQPTTQCN